MEREFSRRAFLRGIPPRAAGVAALALGASLIRSSQASEVDFQGAEFVAELSIVERLKSFEELHGTEPLTVQSAREFTPLIADFFVSSTKSQTPSESLASSVFAFAIEGDEVFLEDYKTASLERLKQTKIIQNLQENYPELELTEDLARTIYTESLPRMFGQAMGFVVPDGHYIFVNINELNKFDQVAFPSLEAKHGCIPTRPALSFRSIITHEFIHKDIQPAKPASDTLNQAMKTHAFYKLDSIDDSKTEAFNFIAKFNGKEAEGNILVMEELTTTYLESLVASSNGLKFISPAYGSPIDLLNYRKIMRMAGISDKQLFQLHKNGDLETFLLKVGRASKKGKGLTGEKLLEVAIKIAGPIDFDQPPGWWDLKADFDGLDTASGNEIRKTQANACVISK